MSKRLLLIEANDNTRWVGSRVGPKVHVLPIALMGLAAHARAVRPDLVVQIVETALDAPGDVELARFIDQFRPDWIGIRSISLFIDEVRRVVRVANSASPAPLLLGGPVATALGEALFAQVPGLHYVAQGEGEPIVAALVSGVAPTLIPGVLARGQPAGASINDAGHPPIQLGGESGSARATAATQLRSKSGRVQTKAATVDLEALAFPGYDLIDLGRYEKTLSYAYNQRRQGVLVTSRGCPFACTYCFQISDAPARLQSAERVMADIRRLHDEFDVADFYFVDDLFNLNRKRALRVFEQLIETRLRVRLHFVNGLRVDLCDEAFIDRMVEAGTVWVTYAIETACPRIQRLIRKPIDLAYARHIINYTQRKGIVVNVNTMFGFPTETATEAEMTLDYLGSLDHPSLLPYHFNLRGYPGCEIVEQAERAGWSRDAFLATGFSSYGDLPAGSPTFSRREMMQHLLRFHESYGLANRRHLDYSVRTLRQIGYRDAEITDMYTVLMNREIATIDQLIESPHGNSSEVRWA